MKKKNCSLLLTILIVFIGLFKANAQVQMSTLLPKPGETYGYWSGLSKSCNGQRGYGCLKSNKLLPSFDLVAFDNMVALGNIDNTKNYIIANNLEAALGASATSGFWVGAIKGFKDGTVSLIKINGVSGYEYMVGTVMPQGKYNTPTVKGFLCHIAFYQ